MNRNGDIIIIEDDADERDILNEVFSLMLKENGMKNQLIFIDDSTKVVPYLTSMKDKPFLIISDINMPKLDGLTLRNRICENPILYKQRTPYIFLSTAADPAMVKEAYQLDIHGYFVKPSSYHEYIGLAQIIFSYWEKGVCPP